MTQKKELIKRLEARQNQLSQQLQDKREGYKITSMHHMMDVMTVLAVLKGDDNADKLLENMPNGC